VSLKAVATGQPPRPFLKVPRAVTGLGPRLNGAAALRTSGGPDVFAAAGTSIASATAASTPAAAAHRLINLKRSSPGEHTPRSLQREGSREARAGVWPTMPLLQLYEVFVEVTRKPAPV
jgi:hypothetical protein